MSGRHELSAAMESDDEDTAVNRDWSKMIGNMQNDGYRLGLESSQEESLQFGFNTGFTKALQMALAGGKLQGELSAQLGIPCTPAQLTQQPTATSQRNVSSLESECSSTVRGSPLPSLDCLVTSCSNLIGEIPSYLKQEKAFLDPAWSLRERESQNLAIGISVPSELSGVAHSASLAEVGKREVTTTMSCDSPSKPKSDSQGETVPSVCESVCRNKSDFWTRLETFRDQAEALQLT